MPIYTFRNMLTNEQYDEIMTYEELQEYIKQEHIEQVFKINLYILLFLKCYNLKKKKELIFLILLISCENIKIYKN